MRWSTPLLLIWLSLPILLLAPDSHAAPPTTFDWPLRPRPPILRPFDAPEHDWLPGHRGVDLGGAPGQSVLAAGDGTTAFAAEVAGKPVVSIDHPGGLRTTYEPVRATTTAGHRIHRGDPIGTLEPGHPSCPTTCLHWGLRRGHNYLDPLRLIRPAPLRLKPIPLSRNLERSEPNQ